MSKENSGQNKRIEDGKDDNGGPVVKSPDDNGSSAKPLLDLNVYPHGPKYNMRSGVMKG